MNDYNLFKVYIIGNKKMIISILNDAKDRGTIKDFEVKDIIP